MAKKVKASELTVNLPFKLGELKFIPDENEQKAAWELYIELSTRITIEPFNKDYCSIREALVSIYSIFSSTREILKKYGPAISIKENSFGRLAIKILNLGLRPFISKWNSKLAEYESTKPNEISRYAYEREWEMREFFLGELKSFQIELMKYVEILEIIYSS